MITVVEGNLLEAREDVICHQVNCQGVMGKGIAKQIKDKYPEVFKEYKYILDIYGSQVGHCQLVACNDGKNVANLFGQDGYGRDRKYTEYGYLKRALQELRNMVIKHNLTVAFPYKLGCANAGGDWDIVYKMIDDIFSLQDVMVYKYQEV
jgi:O-acetyl-ADP-ribose deacetylase (regulator of RNase III)